MGEQYQLFGFPVAEDKYFPPHAGVVPQDAHLQGGFALDRQLSNASSGSLSSGNCFSTPPTSPVDNTYYNKMYSPIKYESESNSAIQQQYETSHGHYFQQPEVKYTPKSLGWSPNTHLLKLYTFVVPKTKDPYFQLSDPYTATYETPAIVYLDERPRGYRKDQFPCLWPVGCTGKQTMFGRQADLHRHYMNVHSDVKDKFPCDYPKCPRALDPFSRKDHYRDHFKCYHKEDLGPAPGERGRGKESRKGQQARDAWLAERRIDDKWWRCAHCLVRNYVAGAGWVCSSCKVACEDDRRAAREPPGTDSYDAATSYQACGACNGQGWVENGLGAWMLCGNCQPVTDSGTDSYQYNNPGYSFTSQ